MEIQRIITRLRYNCAFDLNHIRTTAFCVTKTTSNFNAITLVAEPQSYCQIFSNGKCVLNGGKSESEVENLIEFYTYVLQLLDYKAVVTERSIVNIVATYTNHEPVRLHNLSRHQELVWEPELFPAVKYRIHDLGVTINIFASGKCVLLGAKSENIVNLAHQKLLCLLLNVKHENFALEFSSNVT